MDRIKISLFTRYFVRPIINVWIGKVSGLENIPKNKAFILAPNHCSYIEHFIIGAVLVPYLSKKLHFIAKQEHFITITQSNWHRLWGKYATPIPIDRSKGKEALRSALLYLKKSAVIIIYPEGTRSLTGKIQKGKTGIARLALWANVPIIPLGIKGTFEILPKGETIPRFKKATLNFGKPIYFDKYYSRRITKKLLRTITDNIMKEIARLSGQKYNF